MNYCVHVLTNKGGAVLYAGVTSDLIKRVWQHREHLVDGFTKRYNCDKLVYYEMASSPMAAIAREKQIKGGSRQDKLNLIGKFNPEWKDLYEDISRAFV